MRTSLDDSTRCSCNLSARARESKRAAVHWKLDDGAVQVDKWPVSSLSGERMGAGRPAYATDRWLQLCAGKIVGL
jgi:hypothetical protein